AVAAGHRLRACRTPVELLLLRAAVAVRAADEMEPGPVGDALNQLGLGEREHFLDQGPGAVTGRDGPAAPWSGRLRSRRCDRAEPEPKGQGECEGKPSGPHADSSSLRWAQTFSNAEAYCSTSSGTSVVK